MRMGRSIDKKRPNLGNDFDVNKLTVKQRKLLEKFDNDVLRRRVNELTVELGAGRFHGKDGSHFDIGGNNTRSYTRKNHDDYTPPDHTEFMHVNG